jgi:hypothetical protein
MNISKTLTLYTAAIGGAWIGSNLYYSQNTYVSGKHYVTGWMAITLFGGISSLVLTHKYCPRVYKS